MVMKKQKKCTYYKLLENGYLIHQVEGQSFGLVGPPGVGKTLLAKSVSDALDIPFGQITLEDKTMVNFYMVMDIHILVLTILNHKKNG